MSRPVRATAAVVLTVAIVAGTVIWVSSLERSTANSGYERALVAQRLLTAMLDRETGLRGYLATARQSFLDPYRKGAADFQAAVEEANRDVREVPAAAGVLTEQVDYAAKWERLAESTIAAVMRSGAPRTPLDDALARKHLMDEFRAANARYLAIMNGRRIADLSGATTLSNWIVVVLSFLLVVAGLALVRVSSRREERRRAVVLAAEKEREERERAHVEAQRQFAEIVQVSETEAEARELIKRRIELSIPGSAVVVLNRNNSANRLEAVTQVDPDVSLTDALMGARPRSCLAIRLGQTHREGEGDGRLVSCELCGKMGAETTCEPLLVGGKVIGSLLISHQRELDDHQQRMIAETVGYAAPVLANLRNLAIAERRAYTDSLTALPNRRALDDTFKLMLAQAGRVGAPLAVMLIDLDHFKRVNDTYGHDCGDEVLATVSMVLAESVRSSDFVARMGGEEFVVLLPATDALAAQTVAKAISAALDSTKIAKIGQPVTASFGVAAYPEHGADAETLLRSADRALYQAKQDGRNCVRLAVAALARGRDDRLDRGGSGALERGEPGALGREEGERHVNGRLLPESARTEL